MNARVQRPRWIVAWCAGALCMALGGVSAVKVRTEVQRARYELGELEARTRELQHQVEQLRQQAQVLAAPSRIAELARAQGMVRETPEAWLEIDPLLARIDSSREGREP